MTGLSIDQFLPDDVKKSSLYTTVKSRAKAELNLDENTSHRNFPLIIIDGKPAYFGDLNKYETSEIKTIKFLTKDDKESVIYGYRGTAHGIILVETK